MHQLPRPGGSRDSAVNLAERQLAEPADDPPVQRGDVHVDGDGIADLDADQDFGGRRPGDRDLADAGGHAQRGQFAEGDRGRGQRGIQYRRPGLRRLVRIGSYPGEHLVVAAGQAAHLPGEAHGGHAHVGQGAGHVLRVQLPGAPGWHVVQVATEAGRVRIGLWHNREGVRLPADRRVAYHPRVQPDGAGRPDHLHLAALVDRHRNPQLHVGEQGPGHGLAGRLVDLAGRGEERGEQHGGRHDLDLAHWVGARIRAAGEVDEGAPHPGRRRTVHGGQLAEQAVTARVVAVPGRVLLRSRLGPVGPVVPGAGRQLSERSGRLCLGPVHRHTRAGQLRQVLLHGGVFWLIPAEGAGDHRVLDARVGEHLGDRVGDDRMRGDLDEHPVPVIGGSPHRLREPDRIAQVPYPVGAVVPRHLARIGQHRGVGAQLRGSRLDLPRRVRQLAEQRLDQRAVERHVAVHPPDPQAGGRPLAGDGGSRGRLAGNDGGRGGRGDGRDHGALTGQPLGRLVIGQVDHEHGALPGHPAQQRGPAAGQHGGVGQAQRARAGPAAANSPTEADR